ncbi:MAG: hypothetical protein Q4G51_09270 [Dermatophilus congolensis]|nr:hypothetical protein [Dermatophilus congolensis]
METRASPQSESQGVRWDVSLVLATAGLGCAALAALFSGLTASAQHSFGAWSETAEMWFVFTCAVSAWAVVCLVGYAAAFVRQLSRGGRPAPAALAAAVAAAAIMTGLVMMGTFGGSVTVPPR